MKTHYKSFFVFFLAFGLFFTTKSQTNVEWSNFFDGISETSSGVIERIDSTVLYGGAEANNVITAGQNGWIKVKCGQNNTRRYFGLSKISMYNSSAGGGINYGFYFSTTGKFAVMESGVLKTSYLNFNIADSVQIERLSDTIYYWHINGSTKSLVYKRNVDQGENLFGDATIVSIGGTFEHAIIASDGFIMKTDFEKDAYIYSNGPNANYGYYSTIVSRHLTSPEGKFRSLFKFKTNTLENSDTIYSSYIFFRSGTHSPLDTSNVACLKRATASWEENTVTWNNQPGSDTTNQLFLAYPTTSTQSYTPDITAFTRSWVKGITANYGLLIRHKYEISDKILVFCSKDHPNSDLRPFGLTLYSHIPSITPNDTICAGITDTIIAKGGVSYLWNTSSTNDTLIVNPTTTTRYTVTITYSDNRTDTLSTLVSVNPLPSMGLTASQSAICLGSSSTLTASGGISYNWSNGLGTNDTVVVSPNASINYQVRVTNSYGCSSVDSVSVHVNPLPTINAGSDTSILSGDSIRLSISSVSGYSYSWSQGTYLSDSTVAQPWAKPVNDNTYHLTIADVNGCYSTDSVELKVIPICGFDKMKADYLRQIQIMLKV